jgi:hypothetical protein
VEAEGATCMARDCAYRPQRAKLGRLLARDVPS